MGVSGSKQKVALKTKMMGTLLIFTLAAISSALPMGENRQCEGTLCHAGCCPMQGWYCCEDNMNCAATAEECPSFSSTKHLRCLVDEKDGHSSAVAAQFMLSSQQYHPCIGQHPAWHKVPSH